MDNFTKVYENSKQLIDLAIRKCGIRYNLDHYRQIASIALWKAYVHFQGEDNEFAPYAFVFIKNELLNEIRRMARVDQRTVLTDNHEMLEVLANEKDETCEDITDFIEELLLPLKEEDKQILIALYVHGYTYTQVASALGISVHALKKRRDRIISKLRSQREIIFKYLDD